MFLSRLRYARYAEENSRAAHHQPKSLPTEAQEGGGAPWGLSFPTWKGCLLSDAAENQLLGYREGPRDYAKQVRSDLQDDRVSSYCEGKNVGSGGARKTRKR